MLELDTSLVARFRTLGAVRALALQTAQEALYAPDEAEADRLFHEFTDYGDGAVLIAEALGLTIDRGMILPDFDAHTFVARYYFNNTLVDNQIRRLVETQYGEEYGFQFSISQLLATLRIIASFFRELDLRAIQPRDRERWHQDRARAHVVLDSFGETVSSWSRHAVGESWAEDVRNLARFLERKDRTRRRFETVYDATEDILIALLPQYPRISESLARARQLQCQLQLCPPGAAAWPHFEECCIQTLRFLFLPPFRWLHVQPASGDGHQRRDAALPNNNFGGFWGLVRQEFDSRHVVCEFKNKAKVGKDDLHQLRIYLSSPAIGRFGLLFCRAAPTRSFLQARRNAYGEGRILVLPIHDGNVRDLLLARSFLGAADHVLERWKAEFEITF